jgi:hypothetical protein
MTHITQPPLALDAGSELRRRLIRQTLRKEMLRSTLARQLRCGKLLVDKMVWVLRPLAKIFTDDLSTESNISY